MKLKQILTEWHDPFKLDRFGCEYFLAEEATHEAQGKQSASSLKTIDAVTNGERPHSSLGYQAPDQFAQNPTVQPADTRSTSMPK